MIEYRNGCGKKTKKTKKACQENILLFLAIVKLCENNEMKFSNYTGRVV